METIKTDILVIGGGIAGITFAENYKRLNNDKKVVVVEKEDTNIYSKVLLPNFIKGLIPKEKVFIRTREQIEQKNIVYLTNESVDSCDANNKIATSSKHTFEYQTLVIATGGDARNIAAGENIFYLQTLDDAIKIKSKLDKLSKGTKATVIGGGFIGIEFLEIFKEKGVEITNLIRNGIYFGKSAPSVLTEKLNLIFEKEQIKIQPYNNIKTIEQTNIKFDNKELQTNIIGIGAGITLNDQITKNRHEVNQFLQLSTDTYLIGDLAVVCKDQTTRGGGNWNNAIAQGMWLARYLSHEITTPFVFGRTSDYSTRFFGNNLIFMGITNQDQVKNKVLLNKENKLYIECYINEKLSGAILLNSPEKRAEIATKLNT